MAFTLEIEGFGVMPVVPPFVPEVKINRRNNGQVQSLEDIWKFKALLPVDLATPIDPTGLQTQRNALIEAFSKVGAARVTMKLNGVLFEEIGQPKHPRGAFIRNLTVEETGGEWVSVLSVTFEVFGERPVEIDQVFDATVRTATTEEEGRSRISLSVEARGPGALAFVRAQKPVGTTRSSIIEIPINDRVTGTFDIIGAGQESSIEESVEIIPGLFALEFALATRSENPIPVWSSRQPTRIRINGSLEVRVGTRAVPPVSNALARYAIPGGIRIGRNVRQRSGTSGETPFERFTYSMEFAVPFDVTMEQLLAERRALGASTFLADESQPSGFQGVELSGNTGIIDPNATPSSLLADPRAGLSRFVLPGI